MNTLFDLNAYYQPKVEKVSDPYWDSDFMDDNDPNFSDDKANWPVILFDDSVTEDNNSTQSSDSVTTDIKFDVDQVYWHIKKQKRVLIIKIFPTARTADVYFEREFEKFRVSLLELTTLDNVTESSSTDLQKTNSVTTLESLPGDSVTAINIYKAKGKARGENFYYRYTYRDGKRLRHVHIPGGNINNPMVQERVEKLKIAIAQKLPPDKIEQMIKQFKQH